MVLAVVNVIAAIPVVLPHVIALPPLIVVDVAVVIMTVLVMMVLIMMVLIVVVLIVVVLGESESAGTEDCKHGHNA
jgi:hypothetical protein